MFSLTNISMLMKFLVAHSGRDVPVLLKGVVTRVHTENIRSWDIRFSKRLIDSGSVSPQDYREDVWRSSLAYGLLATVDCTEEVNRKEIPRHTSSLLSASSSTNRLPSNLLGQCSTSSLGGSGIRF